MPEDKMWLVTGLGNPGLQYAKNWHNCGYRTLDLLAERHKLAVDRIRFHALSGIGMIGGCKCLLIKPTTYMNLSGESIREASAYYHIEPDHCLVIYDDVDIRFGQIRIRENGGPGTHNGMRSVVHSLDSELFPRVRIGIGPQPELWDIADYVLSNLPESAWDDHVKALNEAADAVEMILQKGIAVAMNHYNRR
ncbi:MAG: aminoacyl-tRNA hydrolase [Clostridiaceae bacterium]|nr:aminoacyl-tRNA hydrolase [Clostridiaceae bacterium]